MVKPDWKERVRGFVPLDFHSNPQAAPAAAAEPTPAAPAAEETPAPPTTEEPKVETPAEAGFSTLDIVSILCIVFG